MIPDLKEFPRVVIKIVESSPQFITYKKEKESLVDKNHFFETPNRVIKHKTFINDFNLSDNISFPALLPLEKLIDSDVFNKIGEIIEFLMTNESIAYSFYTYSENYIKYITESDRNLDILATFIVIFSKITEKFVIPAPSLFITCPILYSSDCTIYSHDNDIFPLINTLRSISVDLSLIDRTNKVIQSVLYSLLHKPLAFSEYVNRLIAVQPQISLSEEGFSLITQSMMYSMAFYLTFNNLTEEQRIDVCKARRSIFIFMNNYLIREDLMLKFFNDTLFIECFIGMIYEEPVRKFILSHLSRYLSIKESENNAELFDKIMKISSYVAENTNDNDVIRLGASLFKSIVPFFTISQKMKGFFEPIVASLCKGIVKLEKTEYAADFLVQVISLLNITTNHLLSSPEIHSIQVSIANIFGDNPTQQIFVKLVQLIAGQPIANVHPSFIIAQPKVIKLLITAFLNSSILDQVLDFVAELLQYSTTNCDVVKENELDIFLINIIYSWRNDSKRNIKTVARMFSLLMIICSYSSTLTTVRKFISLLCPIDGRSLPFYHQISLKSISSMLSKSNRNPSSFLPLDNSHSFFINGLKGEDLNKEFSISFWLFCKSNDTHYKAQIATLADDNDSSICIYLNGESLLLLFENYGDQWSGRPEVKIPIKEWCFINITLRQDAKRNQFYIHTSINANSSFYTSFPLFQFKEGPLSAARIGGLSLESEEAETPSYIGPIGLFPALDNDQRVSLYDDGPLGTAYKNLNPIFYIISKDFANYVSPTNLSKAELTFDPPKIKYKHSFTFSDILLNKCGISILLPLFAQWDLPLSTGGNVPFICEATIEVLENALSYSKEAQKSFAESKGFQILSYILLSTNETNITYGLYSRFSNLLGVVKSKVAYSSLFNDIVTNIDIWIRCDSTDHLRILKHWSRVLVQSDLFSAKYNFSFILSLLRIYYWYEKEQIDDPLLCQRRCRGQELNVKECRKILLEIAYIVAHQSFTKEDFVLLISHIITIGALQQNIDLLEFLIELINDPSHILIKSNSDTNQISLLQYLFNLKNERIVALLINTVVDAHRNNLIHGISLVDHLDIVLHQITHSFVSKSLLIKLVETANKNKPELLPICSWMAVNIGEKAVKFLLDNIKPQKSYVCTRIWSMWLVVAVYKARKEMRRRILKFLIECAQESDLINVFLVIDVVGKALNEDYDSAKHDFLFEVGKFLLKKDSKVNYSDYIMLIKHFILFRDDNSGSLALQSLFNCSLFSETGPKIRIQHGTPPRPIRILEKKHKYRNSISVASIGHFEEKTENYSPLLAQKALATLTNNSALVPSPRNKARRESYVKFRPLPFEYELNIEVEKPLITMMPAELDKKFSFVATEGISYRFGIRFNKSGQWLDYDLSEQFIDVFTNKPEQSESLFALTLAAYLKHFDCPKIPKVLKVINKNDISLNPPLYLMAHHAQLAYADIPFKITKKECEMAAFQFSESLESIFANDDLKYASLRLLKHILKMQTANSTYAFKIYGMVSDFTVSISSNEINNHSDIVIQNQNRDHKLWETLWRSLTFNNAPWCNSLPKSVRDEIHYKRDNTLGPLMVPVKMKRNYKFDKHLDASCLRDSGDAERAHVILDQKKKELNDEYRKNAPAQLFEITEEEKDDEVEEKTEAVEKQKKFIIELHCELIKNTGVKEGTFALTPQEIIINFDNGSVKTIKNNKITAIFLRTRFHLPSAIEIFIYTGKSYFINFPGIKSISVLKHFHLVDMPSIRLFQTTDFKHFFGTTGLTKKWMNRELSNFEYLIHLNILSGRSFNDVSQYPIFPWVIKDYESLFLDLEDEEMTFRDLTKPVGVIGSERLENLKKNSKMFEQMGDVPYLFSSGYSYPLSIYLWLMRIEPFTSLHIDIQGGQFDKPARLFSSIPNAWKLCTNYKNDFKEMIPEFFSQPEFLLNKDKFDLGSTEDEVINDVILPPWAQTPYDFVYKNRKALESNYVSEHLNNWIDLIWGFQSRGKEAKKIDNIYPPEMYDSIWTSDKLQDPQERANIEAILCHVGQIPPQLFKAPHPKRIAEVTKESSLARAVISPLGIKTVIASAITITPTKKFRFIILDESGTMKIILYDSATINKKSKNVIRKPRTRSGSSRINTGSSGSQWKSPRKYGLKTNECKAIEISSLNTKYITKIFRQFASVRPATSTKSNCLSVYSQEGTFFFVGSQKSDLIQVNASTNNIIVCNTQTSSITTLACDNNWLLTANSDSVISIFNARNSFNPVFTIQCYTSTIICSCVSTLYHQIACGTKDGSLIIASLNNGSITRIVDLEGMRPISICITDSWGFIIVYATDLSSGVLKHYIKLFSINGDKIRETEINTGIQAWSCYSDEKDIDYVVLVDECGDIFHFEAFYLDLGRRVISVTENFASISYIPEDCIIAGVTRNGKVLFVPSVLE